MTCALAFFVIGSLPASAASSPAISDKLLHLLGFGLLAALWCRALGRLWPAASISTVALGGAAVSSALGGALELWQGMLGYRSREWLDFCADVLGAALAALAWAVWQRISVRPAAR